MDGWMIFIIAHKIGAIVSYLKDNAGLYLIVFIVDKSNKVYIVQVAKVSLFLHTTDLDSCLKTITAIKMSQTVALDNLCYLCCFHEHTVVWLELIPFCCCKYSLEHEMCILSLKIVTDKCTIYFCLSNVC